VASILFATVGSWGDLFPFVGVAAELQRRGHDARIAASPAWRDIVTAAHTEFVPIGRPIGFDEFRQHPEIFGRLPFGLRAALNRFVFDQIDVLTEDLASAMDGVDLVVAHPAQLAAMNIAERFGTRRVVGTIFPSMIPSSYTVPGGSPVGPWSGTLGRVANKAAWVNASAVTALLFDRPINRHRRQLGLDPIRGAIIRLPLQADAMVVMAPPDIVGRPPDLPHHIVFTSFVGWDGGADRPLTSGTNAFLEAGDAPVLVTLGASSAVAAEDFFDHVTREVVDAGARALVVTGPAPPPEGRFDRDVVHVTDFEPFSNLAHRCRAAVHHAGIGTTIAVMRAGVPHLAVPRGFDQPQTAGLIEKLGVGVTVSWRHRRRGIRPGLERLLRDERLRVSAERLRETLGDDGAPPSANAVERCLNTP